MNIGFVILTYNRSDALLAVLRALAPQCVSSDSIVIADDGSQPQQVEALKKGLPRMACRVRHVWHPDTGFTAARARNLGALQAQAKYLVFMDGDCVPHPHFVQQHRQLARPGCFVNGSRVLLGQALSEQVVRNQVDLATLSPWQWLKLFQSHEANKLSHLLRWPAAPGRLEKRFRWQGIRSCNLGVWWRDFEAVNGFDESFQGWGHEDADLVLRLHRSGLWRKNGWLSTEVFHLWHTPHSRANEADNRARVLARMKANSRPQAQQGLAQARQDNGVRITELTARMENSTA